MASVGINIIPSGSSSAPLDNIIAVANLAALPGAGTTEGRVLYYVQDTKTWYWWDGDSWEIFLDDSSYALLMQVAGDLAAHIAQASDAHDASAISNVPAGNLAATDVQGALDELQADADTNATNLADHLADATDAHDASAISYDNVSSGLTATEVQGAIDEMSVRVDTLEAGRGYTVVANTTPVDLATFTPADNRRQVQQISGSGGAVTLTDLGILNAQSGDELVLLGTDDANTVTLNSATNTIMNGSITLANNDMITFVFVNAKWREQSRSA
jgi:hypothetical protein